MYDTRALCCVCPFSGGAWPALDEAALKQMDKKYFKLLLIGDSGVGKMCMQTRYVEDTFKPPTFPTLGELSCFHCTCNYK